MQTESKDKMSNQKTTTGEENDEKFTPHQTVGGDEVELTIQGDEKSTLHQTVGGTTPHQTVGGDEEDGHCNGNGHVGLGQWLHSVEEVSINTDRNSEKLRSNVNRPPKAGGLHWTEILRN